MAEQKTSSIDVQKIIRRMVLVVSLGIMAHLIFLLLTTDRSILSNISKIKIPYLILIGMLALVPWFGHSLRLMIWTKFAGHPLKYLDCFRTAVYTELGGSLSPTLIGGGPIKLAYLLKKGLNPGKAGLITALNGFEDFIMYSLILLISFIHVRESIERILNAISGFVVGNYIYIISGIVLFFLLRWLLKKLKFSFDFLVPDKFSNWWKGFKQAAKDNWDEMKGLAVKILKEGKLTFSLSFLLLILSWLGRFSILLVILYALGIDFKPFQMYLQQWIVYITMLFIPTPGASGGAEASFFLIFGGEIPKHILPLIVSTWRFFIYYFMLFVAIILVQVFSVWKRKGL